MVFIRAKRGFFSPEVVFFNFEEKKIIKKKNSKFLTKIFVEHPCFRPGYSQIWPNLGQILVNFGQNGSFLNFPKTWENVIFFDSRD